MADIASDTETLVARQLLFMDIAPWSIFAPKSRKWAAL
jgi:hypothetical protein